jgi:hypothetical protein
MMRMKTGMGMRMEMETPVHEGCLQTGREKILDLEGDPRGQSD